uniref:Uncharacterized protein n=1 Tax=Leersia perrieri TaxID=77586 RepID=A0A0D9UWE8_9ORYZ
MASSLPDPSSGGGADDGRAASEEPGDVCQRRARSNGGRRAECVPATRSSGGSRVRRRRRTGGDRGGVNVDSGATSVAVGCEVHDGVDWWGVAEIGAASTWIRETTAVGRAGLDDERRRSTAARGEVDGSRRASQLFSLKK